MSEDQAAVMDGGIPLQPIPVHGSVHAHIQGVVPTKASAAEYGAWITYVLAATAAAQKILPHDENRARALLVVSGTGPVYIGSQAQAQSSPVQGGVIPSPAVIELKNKRELWLAPDGTHTATVSVLMERWGT